MVDYGSVAGAMARAAGQASGLLPAAGGGVSGGMSRKNKRDMLRAVMGSSPGNASFLEKAFPDLPDTDTRIRRLSQMDNQSFQIFWNEMQEDAGRRQSATDLYAGLQYTAPRHGIQVDQSQMGDLTYLRGIQGQVAAAEAAKAESQEASKAAMDAYGIFQESLPILRGDIDENYDALLQRGLSTLNPVLAGPSEAAGQALATTLQTQLDGMRTAEMADRLKTSLGQGDVTINWAGEDLKVSELWVGDPWMREAVVNSGLVENLSDAAHAVTLLEDLKDTDAFREHLGDGADMVKAFFADEDHQGLDGMELADALLTGDNARYIDPILDAARDVDRITVDVAKDEAREDLTYKTESLATGLGVEFDSDEDIVFDRAGNATLSRDFQKRMKSGLSGQEVTRENLNNLGAMAKTFVEQGIMTEVEAVNLIDNQRKRLLKKLLDGEQVSRQEEEPSISEFKAGDFDDPEFGSTFKKFMLLDRSDMEQLTDAEKEEYKGVLGETLVGEELGKNGRSDRHMQFHTSLRDAPTQEDLKGMEAMFREEERKLDLPEGITRENLADLGQVGDDFQDRLDVLDKKRRVLDKTKMLGRHQATVDLALDGVLQGMVSESFTPESQIASAIGALNDLTGEANPELLAQIELYRDRMEKVGVGAGSFAVKFDITLDYLNGQRSRLIKEVEAGGDSEARQGAIALISEQIDNLGEQQDQVADEVSELIENTDHRVWRPYLIAKYGVEIPGEKAFKKSTGYSLSEMNGDDMAAYLISAGRGRGPLGPVAIPERSGPRRKGTPDYQIPELKSPILYSSP